MSISRCDPPPIESKERYISVYERSVRSNKRTQELECTETIGFESMSLNSAGHFSDGIPAATELVNGDRSIKERRRKKEKDRVNFPPVLTILNGENGRPRFSFKKEMTVDGRLTMEMEESEEREEIIRCFRGDGRLKMELVGERNEEFGCVTVVD